MKLVTLILPMFKLESFYNIMQQTVFTLVSVEIYTYINVFYITLSEVYVWVGNELFHK